MIALAQPQTNEFTSTLAVHRDRIAALEVRMRKVDLHCAIKIGAELSAVQKIFRVMNEHRQRNRNEPGLKNWARDQCGISQSTLFDYLNIYKQFHKTPKPLLIQLNLCAAAILARPTTSPEARREALDRAKRGEVITMELADRIRGNHGILSHPNDHSRKRMQTRPHIGEYTHCGHNGNGHFDTDDALEQIRDLIYKIRDHMPKAKWTETAKSLHQLIDRQERIPATADK